MGVGSRTDGEFRAMEYSHEAVAVWSDKTFLQFGLTAGSNR